MTSSEISQLTAQSQMMGMSSMQHAAMISQQAGFSGSNPNEALGQHMAGSAINRMSSIGGPAAQAGMALGGVDPFSMGIKGAIGGFAMGGIPGAAAGAALGAGGIGVPMMAAQYAGGQMVQGAQQQQQLGAQLGSSFQFQNRFGGSGFTGGDVSTIGSQFRSQAQQRGPMGESTSFEELSRLASNMGRMGMAQNVRSVKDFQDSFSKMIKQVKEVATAMSTSLEEAQEMMAGMKSAGVFRGQGKVAQQIRETAIGGGLATSEVTGMMRIGAQISRMVGGRGRAGAQAGEQAIGLVGAAQQAGVMSEEDIYNVTGETGAEGRRAMATGMLQTSAKFMKSQRGRIFLASIAGEGGTLNEAAIREYASGHVSVGRSQQLYQQNLAKIGRADFIKNEGRLRGAAMGALGGLAPVLAMRGWLQGRGLVAGTDMAAIAMQRHLGMGTEEVEQMEKMVRNLPRIMETRQNRLGEAEYGKRQQQASSHTNLNQFKRKFEDARNKVQGSLRQLGANFSEEIGNFIERTINKITGDVVEAQAYDVAQLSRGILRGGVQGQMAGERLGWGGYDSSALGAMGKAFQSRIGAQQRGRGRGVTMAGTLGAIARVGTFGQWGGTDVGAGQNEFGTYQGTLESTMKRSGDWERYQRAGAGLGEELGNESLQRQIGMATQAHRSFVSGMHEAMGPADPAMVEALKGAVGSGGIGGGNRERVASFKSMVHSSSEPALKSLASQISGKSDDEVAKIMGQVMTEAGLGRSELEKMTLPSMVGLFQGRGFATDLDRNKAIGKAMFGRVGYTETTYGKTRMTKSGRRHTIKEVSSRDRGGGGEGGKFGARQEYIDRRGEGRSQERFVNTMEDESTREMAARMVDSKEYLEAARSAISLNDEERQKTYDKAVNENSDLLGREPDFEKMSPAARARFETNRALMAGKRMRDLEKQFGGKAPSEAAIASAARGIKMESKQFKDYASGVSGLVLAQQGIESGKVAQQTREAGERGTTGLVESGFISEGGNALGLSQSAMKSLEGIGESKKKGVWSTGQLVGEDIARIRRLQAGMETDQVGNLTKEGRVAYEKLQRTQGQLERRMRGLSDKDLSELGEVLSGVEGARGYGAEATETAGIRQALRAAGGMPTSAAGVVAAQLGVKLTEKQLREPPETIANRMVEEAGLSLANEGGRELKKKVLAGLDVKGSVEDRAAAVLEGRGLIATGAPERAIKAQDEQAAKQDPSFRILQSTNQLMGQLPNAIADAIAGKKLKATVDGFVETAGDDKGGPEGKGNWFSRALGG